MVTRYKPKMNTGEFRHKITFQKPPDPDATNENGFPLTEYTDYISVFAANKTVSGREYHAAAATQNERTVRWIIRYRNDLTEDMRITFEGKRIFEIEAILPDNEMKRTLTVVCKEVL